MSLKGLTCVSRTAATDLLAISDNACTKLDVDLNSLSEEDEEEMVRIIQSNPIRTLILYNTDPDALTRGADRRLLARHLTRPLVRILRVYASNPHKRRLYLGANVFWRQWDRELSAAMSELVNGLYSLELAYSELPLAGTLSMIKYCQRFDTLGKLKLVHTNTPASVLAQLTPWTASTTALHTLRLDNTNFYRTNIGDFLQRAACSTSLTSLAVTRPRRISNVVFGMTQLVDSNTTLRHLDLSGVSTQSCDAILQRLSNNTTLRSLRLNDWCVNAFRFDVDCIVANTTLRTLEIGDVIQEEFDDDLTRLISQNHTLKRFGTPMMFTYTANKIDKSIAHNTTVRSIEAFRNPNFRSRVCSRNRNNHRRGNKSLFHIALEHLARAEHVLLERRSFFPF